MNLRSKQLSTGFLVLALACLPAPAGAPLPQQLVGPPTLVTPNIAGTATGNEDSELTDGGRHLTPHGRFLVFDSEASDLLAVPDTDDGRDDVFLKDLHTGELTLVSYNAAGTAASNSTSNFPRVSNDGRIVAYESQATDLVAGLTDNNGSTDVFVRDVAAGTTTLVSFNHAETGTGADQSDVHHISADGRYVLFTNRDSDDIAGVTDGNGGDVDLFVRDLQDETTELVNFNSDGTASSDDGIAPARATLSDSGRVVAFHSDATDLAANDTNGGFSDVFARDLDSDVTTLVSVNLGGTSSAASDSDNAVVSDNGRFVAFESEATDLVAIPDLNGTEADVFVRDLQAGTTTLVSINGSGTGTGNDESLLEDITPDGQFVLFRSDASDIVADVSDTNSEVDLFVRDLLNGVTTLVSVNSAGTAAGNMGSDSEVQISADGRLVLFESSSTDLVADLTDANGVGDLFLRDLQGGRTTVLTLISPGTIGTNNHVGHPHMSADGMVVAFDTPATNLSDLPDGNSTGDEDVFVVGPADLSLSKSASELVVTQGETITYTLHVMNNTFFDAHGVVITDDLPGNTSVVSAPGCLAAGGDVTCAVGTLKGFESVSFTIRVRVGGNAINDLTNRASVTTSNFEINLGNNSDQVTTRLEGRTQLSLSQFISPNPLVAGEPATKRISVTAVGPGAATGVVISDPLPAGLTFVSAPPGCVFAAGTVTCTPGTLFVNQRALYEIQVMVDADASGSITNVVTATADQADEPAVSSRTVPVNVGGLPIPTPLENGVVDTADFIPFGEPGHAMAPKSLVSIFGSGFIAEGSFSASSIPLPTMLGGLMVTFDGIKAPLILVRPDLIICQLPMGVTLPSATMVIDNGGAGKAVNAPQEVQVAEHSPGVFTLGQDGNGQAIVVHVGTVDLAAPVGTVGNSRPATEGDNLTIYANGLGPVDPPIADGANSCDPDGVCLPDGSNVVLRHTLTTPVIRIGGVEVPAENVLFSGASPASVGVNEVVFMVPAGIPTGDAISLTIEIGGIVSKEVTMAVN